MIGPELVDRNYRDADVPGGPPQGCVLPSSWERDCRGGMKNSKLESLLGSYTCSS